MIILGVSFVKKEITCLSFREVNIHLKARIGKEPFSECTLEDNCFDTSGETDSEQDDVTRYTLFHLLEMGFTKMKSGGSRRQPSERVWEKVVLFSTKQITTHTRSYKVQLKMGSTRRRTKQRGHYETN